MLLNGNLNAGDYPGLFSLESWSKFGFVMATSFEHSSWGRPVHTACTLRTLRTLLKSGNTTEKQTSGFQSRKGGDGIRTFQLTEIRRESVKLG